MSQHRLRVLDTGRLAASGATSEVITSTCWPRDPAEKTALQIMLATC
ncbi:hypothetical protein [Actinomadura citrea]